MCCGCVTILIFIWFYFCCVVFAVRTDAPHGTARTTVRSSFAFRSVSLFQVIRVVVSVPLPDRVAVVLEAAERPPALLAPAPALKGRAEFPLARLVVPREFPVFWDGAQREEIVGADGLCLFVDVVVYRGVVVLVVSYAHVGIARVVDEDRRQVHENVRGSVDLNAVRAPLGADKHGCRRHDQVSRLEIPRGKETQALVFPALLDHQNAFLLLVAGAVVFGLLVLLLVER